MRAGVTAGRRSSIGGPEFSDRKEASQGPGSRKPGQAKNGFQISSRILVLFGEEWSVTENHVRGTKVMKSDFTLKRVLLRVRKQSN